MTFSRPPQEFEQLVVANAAIVDAANNTLSEPKNLRIVDGDIVEIGGDSSSQGVTTIDAGGRPVMPGLIDCHAHPFLADTNIGNLDKVPPTLMTARAGSILEGMLERGFTTIRDASGGDWGIKQAVEDGLINGPRMFIAVRALSQTGGHGDFRKRTDHDEPCACSHALSYTSCVADGIDGVRKAVREQFRQGADQIKIMVSGGVSSPHDPLERNQYSPEEIRVIVEEAERRGTYVMAHAYGDDAIRVALEYGVRTIEHGNLIGERSAKLAAEKGAYVVPTLSTYDVLADDAAGAGWSEDMLAKLDRVRSAGLNSINLCRSAGVKLGFGTDLLGDSFGEQSREFGIRAQVETPAQVLDSATRINAEILQQEGRLGVIAQGAIADILILDRNPLEDLTVLEGQGLGIKTLLKQGAVYKNELVVA